jgi:hypothetical protein
LIDTSTTSAFVSVCNSETIGDYPACDSRTSDLLVLVALQKQWTDCINLEENCLEGDIDDPQQS